MERKEQVFGSFDSKEDLQILIYRESLVHDIKLTKQCVDMMRVLVGCRYNY